MHHEREDCRTLQTIAASVDLPHLRQLGCGWIGRSQPLCWSVLGPHRIGKHRSWAGTNGHGRYVEAAGWRIFIAPTWDAGALQRWVRIPPPPPSSCAVCAGQSGCRPVSEGRWLAGCSPFAHKERQEPNTRRAPPLVHGGLVACRGVHRPPGPRAGQTARPGNRKGQDHDRGRRQLRRQPHRRPPGPLHRSAFRATVPNRSAACRRRVLQPRVAAADCLADRSARSCSPATARWRAAALLMSLRTGQGYFLPSQSPTTAIPWVCLEKVMSAAPPWNEFCRNHRVPPRSRPGVQVPLPSQSPI